MREANALHCFPREDIAIGQPKNSPGTHFPARCAVISPPKVSHLWSQGFPNHASVSHSSSLPRQLLRFACFPYALHLPVLPACGCAECCGKISMSILPDDWWQNQVRIWA